MKKPRVSGLPRSLNLKYPPNAAIMLFCVVLGGLAFALRLRAGFPLVTSTVDAIRIALSVGLTWAVGREIDPDHDRSALVAAGFAALALAYLPEPNLLLVLWMLLLARLTSRTPGMSLTILDRLSVLFLGGWLAWQSGWLYAALTAVAFLADGHLSGSHRPQLAFATSALLLSAGLGVVRGPLWGVVTMPVWGWILVLVTSSLFSAVLLPVRRVSASVGDASGDPLDPTRVRAAQGLTLASAWAATLWDGEPTLVSTLPLWWAMLAAGLHALTSLAVRRLGLREREP